MATGELERGRAGEGEGEEGDLLPAAAAGPQLRLEALAVRRLPLERLAPAVAGHQRQPVGELEKPVVGAQRPLVEAAAREQLVAGLVELGEQLAPLVVVAAAGEQRARVLGDEQ